MTLKTATEKRSSGWVEPACGPSSPAPTCCTESGCADRAAAPMHASTSAPHTTSSSRSACERSPRPRRELAATGETVRKRHDNRLALAPQEAQITRLTPDGLTNPDIGAQLFISARTVEWHLHNAFTKLGITNRRQLRGIHVDGGELIDNGHRRQ